MHPFIGIYLGLSPVSLNILLLCNQREQRLSYSPLKALQYFTDCYNIYFILLLPGSNYNLYDPSPSELVIALF